MLAGLRAGDRALLPNGTAVTVVHRYAERGKWLAVCRKPDGTRGTWPLASLRPAPAAGLSDPPAGLGNRQ